MCEVSLNEWPTSRDIPNVTSLQTAIEATFAHMDKDALQKSVPALQDKDRNSYRNRRLYRVILL